MDIDFYVFITVKTFICLKRYKKTVSYSVAFYDCFSGIQLFDCAFDIVDHLVCFLVYCSVRCKIMIKSCKRKIVFAKFASYCVQ